MDSAQTASATHPAPAPATSRASPLPHANPHDADPGLRTPGGFDALCAAYQGFGGIARADDLARLMEDQRHAYFVSLEKLVALGVVFGFEWQQAFWVPMFQFEPRDLSVKRAPRQVLAELSSGFDGWKLATWLVRPCPTLNACPPIERLDADVPGVLSAIRADRSIAGR